MTGRQLTGVEADGNCFVCGQLNETGLKAVFSIDMEQRKSHSQLTIPHGFQGWADVVHGGILSALLDEACIYACQSAGQQFVTAELNVKFRKPVTVGTEISITGELLEQRKRIWLARAQIEVNGNLHAEATARVFVLDRGEQVKTARKGPMNRVDELQKTLLTQVKLAMVEYFGSDQRRIDHALQVTECAHELLQFIEADPLLTLCATYLHDIGIPESERKYGHCTGKDQEIEGPPVARNLLQELKADSELIERVCALVSRHHTPRGIDSPEFRILWDADALVNLSEILTDKPPEQIEPILKKSLVTEPGYRRAREIYL